MSAQDDRKVFVGGLADSVTEEFLRTLFTEAGVTVIDVSLPRDRMSGRPRGFGFVTLATIDDAETARNRIDGRMHEGRSISVRSFQSRGAPGSMRPAAANHGPASSVYVANLPFDVTEAEVTEAFTSRDIGVLEVRIPRERGAGRGYGFVSLEKADDVARAVSSVDGADLKGRAMVVKTVRPRGAPSEPPGIGPQSRRGEQPPPSIRPDSVRRRSHPAPMMEPQMAPDFSEAGGGDRRRAQKPKKKESREGRARPSGRPRSSKDRDRAGADWSRRYDRWDDD